MIPLANGMSVWKEPKAVCPQASRVVWAESSAGVFELMTAAEAAAYGGTARELVETVADSGEYELVALGSSAALRRAIAFKTGTTAFITTTT